MIEAPAQRSVLESPRAIERGSGGIFYVLRMRPVQGESSKQKKKSKCQFKMGRSTGERSW
jgi:hypothetical protein